MNPQVRIVDLGTTPPKVYGATRLTQLVDSIAQRLDLAPGTSVGLLGVNSINYIALFLAIQKANCIAVPLNYKLPVAALQAQIATTNIPFVICDAEYMDSVATVAKFSMDQFISQLLQNDTTPLPELDPNRTIYSLFTSGSTGAPKSIAYTHKDRSIVWNRQIGSDSPRTLCVSPLYHIAGINWLEINLVKAGTLFVLPKFSADTFLKTIATYKITDISIVAPVMMMLLQEKSLGLYNLSSVLHISLSSSAIVLNALEKIKKYFINAEILNPYGLTEMPLGVFGPHPNRLPTPELSVGYPLKGIDIKLINDVLYIKTSDLVSSAKNIDEEYYNTRDMFTVDVNGFYFYTGRIDSMFKVGGESVYPESIESVLNLHPSVTESAVIGRPDDVKLFKPHAFVTVNTVVTQQELINWCAARLAPFQIPKTISVIDSIPKTVIGKIDYNELKK
jgi:long-chain acyl-CoA synthetase